MDNSLTDKCSSSPKKETLLLNRFRVIKVIGKGTYGIVTKCEDMLKGEIVAVKIPFNIDGISGIVPTTIREISILTSIKHPKLVKLKETCHNGDTKEIYQIFELMDYDLQDYINYFKGSTIPLENIKNIMTQLLQGVNHLHQNRVFHRDLKPGNILIDAAGHNVKIADFGLSRTFHQPLRPYSLSIQTLMYKAPEVLVGSYMYNHGVDIWSLGCIFANLATGKHLFWDGIVNSEIGMLHLIFQTLGTPSMLSKPGFYIRFENREANAPSWAKRRLGENPIFKHYDGTGFDERLHEVLGSKGINLLGKMLDIDPDSRITCKAALKHPFFN